jgi:hypothetical protein
MTLLGIGAKLYGPVSEIAVDPIGGPNRLLPLHPQPFEQFLFQSLTCIWSETMIFAV